MKKKELIKKIQDDMDKSQAYSELLPEYDRMIKKIIGSFNLENGAFMVDRDELYQEGCLALYKAAQKFDLERGVEFTTYAHRAIRNSIISKLREAKNKAGLDQFSIDNYAQNDYSQIFSVADNCVAYTHENQFSMDIGRFLSKLSEEDKKILKMRQEGYSYKEIASKCGTDEKRVDNRLASIKRRLREYLNK